MTFYERENFCTLCICSLKTVQLLSFFCLGENVHAIKNVNEEGQVVLKNHNLSTQFGNDPYHDFEICKHQEQISATICTEFLVILNCFFCVSTKIVCTSSPGQNVICNESHFVHTVLWQEQLLAVKYNLQFQIITLHS